MTKARIMWTPWKNRHRQTRKQKRTAVTTKTRERLLHSHAGTQYITLPSLNSRPSHRLDFLLWVFIVGQVREQSPFVASLALQQRRFIVEWTDLRVN